MANVRDGIPVYGCNTGYGAQAAKRREEGSGFIRDWCARSISEAICAIDVSVGPAFDRDVVRAGMLIRINMLMAGVSAVKIADLELIRGLLNRNLTPIVHQFGGLGASGDLAQNARIVSVLRQLRGAKVIDASGRIVEASEAMEACGLASLQLDPKAGLGLCNGDNFSTAIASLLAADTLRILLAMIATSAMTIEVLCGTDRVFHPMLSALRPHPGQAEIAYLMRNLLSGIGVPKTVIAARTMLEMNPFLDIRVYPMGVTEENIHDFFGSGGKLDVLVEECDSLWMKIQLREEARRRAIPVVMDTSDRGLLDVERFDLENHRPLFHNLIGDTSSESIKNVSAAERIGFVLKILGADQLSPHASASLLEIGHTISTWPQLGSAVIAGGAVVTDAVRRILLNSFTDSGRFSVDIETIVANGVGKLSCNPKPEQNAVLAPVHNMLEKPWFTPTGTLTEQEFTWLVAHASLAPSGGNSQPWRFLLDDGSVLGFLATERRSPILDFNYTASLLALGAAAENMILAAPELGLTPVLETLPGQPATDPIFRIQFSRETEPSQSAELFREIGARCTNRRLGSRQIIEPAHLQALRDEANQAETTLQILTAPSDLDAIAKIIGYGDRLRFLSESLHAEMIGELRWTAAETSSRRDGIDVNTLELSEGNLAVLRLLSSWPTMARLRAIGGGRGLESPSHDAIAAASGVALLSRRRTGAATHFEGGRALQRIWLRATSLGLSIQPMSVLVYLFDRFENSEAQGLDEDTQQGLQFLLYEFRKLFPRECMTSDLLLFRVAYAEPVSARSNRLEIEQIIVRGSAKATNRIIAANSP